MVELHWLGPLHQWTHQRASAIASILCISKWLVGSSNSRMLAWTRIWKWKQHVLSALQMVLQLELGGCGREVQTYQALHQQPPACWAPLVLDVNEANIELVFHPLLVDPQSAVSIYQSSILTFPYFTLSWNYISGKKIEQGWFAFLLGWTILQGASSWAKPSDSGRTDFLLG